MPTPTRLQNTPWTLKIGGKDMHEFGILSYRMPNLSTPSLGYGSEVYPGEHEAIAYEATFEPRVFAITGRMIADTADDLRTNKDDLARFLFTLTGKQSEIIAPIKLQTADRSDRYYLVCFQGLEMSNDRRSVKNKYADFAMTFLLLEPFALANDIEKATPSGTGPSFQTIDLATAPAWLSVELEGAATAPDFVISNMAFFCDFNYDLEYTKIDGSTANGSSGATTDSDQFELGEHGGRYHQEDFDTTFGSVIQSPTEQTWLIFLRPQFGTDPGADEPVFEYWIDNNNRVYLWWDDSEDKWTLTKAIGGSPVSLAESSSSSHSSDDPMVLAVSFGADGMKVYKNGTRKNVNATTTGVTGTSGTVYLGDSASSRPDAKYDFVIGFPFQLDDDDVLKLSNMAGQIQPHIVKKQYSEDLAANERLVVDFKKGTAFEVATDLTHTNAMANWSDSEAFPILTPPKMCFHVPSGESINGIQLSWRKRYL